MILTLFCHGLTIGQTEGDVVQFSGRVIEMDGEEQRILGLTNLFVPGTSRGTISDIDGFFSFPVREGEQVIFSRVGYELKIVDIPVDIEGTAYTQDIIMNRDTVFLPETLIYPWPDKDFFKIEFLALEVDNVIEDIVRQNLSPERLEFLVNVLPPDGGEVSKIELQQQAASYYYVGQARPQNIFNPLSWKKFIDAIRRGDYKKKK